MPSESGQKVTKKLYNISMNREQIESFVKKIYPSKPIEITYFKNKRKAVAYAYSWLTPPRISINLYFLRQKRYRVDNCKYVKGIILHELGHIENKHKGLDSKQEAAATFFAIRTAEKLKMKDVRDGLLYWIWTHGDPTAKRSKNSKIYYDAYMIMLRDEKWANRYRKISKYINQDWKNLRRLDC